jgi:hypothetical protein
MDRLKRVLAGGALAMTFGTVVAASGCRSTRNEVPPGPKYSNTGDASSSLGFNSAPHQYNGLGANSPYANPSVPGQPGTTGSPAVLGGGAPGSATDPALPPSMGASGSSYGTPTPNGGMGQPTPGLYGPPGTSGIGGTGR